MRLRCTCRATVERDFAAEFVVEGRGCRGCRARPGARQERGRRSDGTRRRLLPPSLSSVLVRLGPFPYRTRPKPNPDQTRNRVPWGKNPCGVCVAQRSVATTLEAMPLASSQIDADALAASASTNGSLGVCAGLRSSGVDPASAESFGILCRDDRGVPYHAESTLSRPCSSAQDRGREGVGRLCQLRLRVGRAPELLPARGV